MSAIFGIWHLDGRALDGVTLCKMSERLAHRGPDGTGVWSGTSVALGHRMLHTTPESLTEQQPLVAMEGDLVLTADARIDNREELIRDLGLSDRPAAEITDPDLILAAYRKWELRCPEHLLGAFAFVIWNERSRRLLCVRDHFGVKPLYYFHAPRRLFAFSSEIDALLTLGDVSRELDELEIARHLLIPVEEDLASTYYRHIRQVRPAHRLAITGSTVQEVGYWSLDSSHELELPSDRAYAEAVRERFAEAVRRRLRSITPVGSMLSGGLDSSSVTCMAAQLLDPTDGPLHTLSAVYPDAPSSDESDYIQAVLHRYDVRPHFFEASRSSPLADADRFHRYSGGANPFGNLHVNWRLSRAAGAAGVRVILDGFDGDTTLSHGHGYLRELALRKRWLSLGREVKPLAELYGEPWLLALKQWYLSYGLGPTLERLRLEPLRQRLKHYRKGGRVTRHGNKGPIEESLRALHPAFGERLKPHLQRTNEKPNTEREHHRRHLLRKVLFDGLRAVESVGAGAGVEIRFPFFDVPLVELCLSLPPEQKIRQGWTRLVMRHAMNGVLPEEICWRRKKSNVSPGFRHALLNGRGGPEAIEIHRAEAALGPYLQESFVRRLRRRTYDGEASDAEELAYWRALSLALWLSSSAEGPPPGATDRQGRERVNLDTAGVRRSTQQEGGYNGEGTSEAGVQAPTGDAVW